MTRAIDVDRVLGALAKVNEALVGVGSRLRSLPEVASATNVCWMRPQERVDEFRVHVGQGFGYSIEWYADAEFVDGRALSFGIELTRHEDEWVIGASVRVNDSDGQDVLIDLPTRFSTDPDDLISELNGQATALVQAEAEALRLFKERSP